ncbi:MAG: DMT family transporter [Rhodospirillaceae bacterium]|nr:MAG: DMT family transporter [Rhodospirillaceae bacterium]
MIADPGAIKPRFILAAIWALLAAASFAVMMASVRYMDGKFDAFEIVFFRALIGIFIVIPLVSKSGVGALKTSRLPMHIVRTLFALFAMATLYYALAFIPIAQAVALTFLIPLFTTIAAGTVLREKVGIHRWGATLAGFGGALVIIRPGVVDVGLPILMVVLSSALYAGAWLSVKVLTRTDSAAVTVFWMNLLMLPLTAIPLVFVWITPGPEDVLPIVIMALSGWAAHFFQARAFKAADASAVMPFDFLRLPLGALFGYLLFAELIDSWTWAGAVVIFLAGYYITRREALKK